MKILRNVYQWFAFALALALLASMQLLWAAAASVLWYCLPAAHARRVGRWGISQMFRRCFILTGWLGILKVDASALDVLDQSESMIIAANHPSVLDALVLISRVDNLNCIMKASLLDNVLLGPGSRLAGYIRNDSPRRMLRLAAAELKRGGQLIVFPEATRTIAAPVNAFKGGFASIARHAGVPIQTVFIETDTPFLSKGWSVLKKPERCPMTFRVRIGRRFEVGPDLTAFVNELHDYFVDELQGADLGDLWTREPPPLQQPLVGPQRCPDLVADDSDPIDDGTDAVTPQWQPARSHSATQW